MRRRATQNNPAVKETFPEQDKGRTHGLDPSGNVSVRGETRDKVAGLIGIGSGRTYDKAKKVWIVSPPAPMTPTDGSRKPPTTSYMVRRNGKPSARIARPRTEEPRAFRLSFSAGGVAATSAPPHTQTVGKVEI